MLVRAYTGAKSLQADLLLHLTEQLILRLSNLLLLLSAQLTRIGLRPIKPQCRARDVIWLVVLRVIDFGIDEVTSADAIGTVSTSKSPLLYIHQGVSPLITVRLSPRLAKALEPIHVHVPRVEHNALTRLGLLVAACPTRLVHETCKEKADLTCTTLQRPCLPPSLRPE